jgi:hypothetical protein
MTSAAVLLHTRRETPPSPAGFLCSTTKVGDVLLGDELCRWLQCELHKPGQSRNIRPFVLPHVSHFMQVPFRTSLELPHSLAPRFSARSPRRRGQGGRSSRRRVIAVKLPSQRFKSNEMPVAPDRVRPIRSSPVFRTGRRSEPAAIGRALRAGVADRSEHVPHFRDRLVRSEAGRGS